MNQLTFFEQPVKKIKIKNIEYGPVKLETVLKELVPDKYIIYPKGGYHYFSKIPEAPKKYREPIWPYITYETKNKIKLAQITPNITFGGYPSVSLKNLDGINVPLQFHRVVAKVYVPNPDPINRIHVAHLNDEVCNYLPTQLEWQSPSENHKGKKTRKSSYQQFYDFFKAQQWIKE